MNISAVAIDVGTQQIPGRLRLFGVIASVVGALLGVLTVTIGVVSGAGPVDALGGPWILATLSFPAAGTLLVLARPDLRFSWLVMGLALAMLTSAVVMASAEIGVGSPALIEAIGYAINTATVTVATVLTMLLFPTGHPPSRRWRLVVPLVLLTAFIGAVASVMNGGWGGDPLGPDRISPLADRVGPVGDILSTAFFIGLTASFLLSAVSLIMRYRRSDGIQRRQLLWLAVAASYMMVLVLSSSIGTSSAGVEGLEAWLTSFAFTLLPTGIVLAVLRYRLYDVDIVINRSLIVAGLALFILVIYVSVVVGLGTLLSATGGANLGLQIGATALAAVGFQPWRRRLRRWADRVVYGHRASPYEVLGSFAGIAAGAPDDATFARIADLLARGTGARPAVVWLRVGDRLQPVGQSPASDAPPEIGMGDTSIVHQDPSTLMVPVEHDGDLMGALTVTKVRGEAVTSQDEHLTRRLADGIAWTLATERLTAELAERAQEVRQSRARIVAEQDAARQQLERDLHDGAQQQLVALKVMLGLARSLADKAGASRTTAMLEQLATDADDAIEQLRDLARGIYPPMLESEGLAAALSAQARKSPLPVRVTGDPGRLDEEVEAAIYFCVMEAMTNAAKYSHSSVIEVQLERQGDTVRFAVQDDGVGFSVGDTTSGTGLSGMHDRIDTAGGTLQVMSEPGGGTTVRGEVTARQPVGAP